MLVTFISLLHNKLRVQQALFFGLAYQGKDIVFRFIIEYSNA